MRLRMYSLWVFDISHKSGLMVAYVQEDGWDALRKTNVPLLQKAIEAVDELSPNLEHVILQTGGKVNSLQVQQTNDRHTALNS